MEDNKQYINVTNGEYTLAETDNPDQFFFYRNDGEELGEVDRLPMDMYQSYVCNKIMTTGDTEIVANNIEFERSTDNKCIRLTVYDMNKELPKKENKVKTFIKTLFKK